MSETIKLWMGNLPYDWQEQDLIDFIGMNDIDVKIMRDEVGRSRGHAVIDAPSSVRDELFALNGKQIKKLGKCPQLRSRDLSLRVREFKTDWKNGSKKS